MKCGMRRGNEMYLRTCHAFFIVGFVKVLLQSQLLGDEVLDVALKVKKPNKFNLACSEKNR